jgi:hypothetical protein
MALVLVIERSRLHILQQSDLSSWNFSPERRGVNALVTVWDKQYDAMTPAHNYFDGDVPISSMQRLLKGGNIKGQLVFGVWSILP